METLFLTVLRMSLSASAVILVVLMIRAVLRNAPKKWSYLLWSVVGFRLCCPVSFRSAFSLFAAAPAQTQKVEQLLSEAPMVAAPTIAPSTVTLPTAAPQITATPQISTVHLWPTLGIILWCVGMAALLIYSLVRILRLRSLLLDAVQLEPGGWQSDRIATPFVMGLIHPKIYIPTETDSETLRYVLAHERVHLKRGDHWIKALAFLLLMVHWFNPLCWLAFVLMNRDMELSCDEQVLAKHGAIARSYSLSLLHFATARRFPAPEMLAFGESDVKRRVKNALKWKRPKRWVTILAASLCVVAVAACAANPRDNSERDAIRNVAMQASQLSVRQSNIVDSNGMLLPGIAESYEEQLQEVFTEDSRYISQYTETMQSIVSSFDDSTDVVLDYQITKFKVRKLKVDGVHATMVCDVTGLQKYIPHLEEGGYAAIFAASKEKVSYALEKGGDGKWRVASFTSEDYVFGTPKEMGFVGEYEEKLFPTREEACRYAASFAPGVQNPDTNTESAAIQRMLKISFPSVPDEVSNVMYSYLETCKNHPEAIPSHMHFEYADEQEAYEKSYRKIVDYEILGAEKINDDLYAFTLHLEKAADTYPKRYYFVGLIDGEWCVMLNIYNIPAELQDGFNKDRFTLTSEDLDGGILVSPENVDNT